MRFHKIINQVCWLLYIEFLYSLKLEIKRFSDHQQTKLELTIIPICISTCAPNFLGVLTDLFLSWLNTIFLDGNIASPALTTVVTSSLKLNNRFFSFWGSLFITSTKRVGEGWSQNFWQFCRWLRMALGKKKKGFLILLDVHVYIEQVSYIFLAFNCYTVSLKLI